jgi:hypothetical protein
VRKKLSKPARYKQSTQKESMATENAMSNMENIPGLMNEFNRFYPEFTDMIRLFNETMHIYRRSHRCRRALCL